MIVDYATVLAYCNKDHSLEVEQIHKSVEDWIKHSTGHDWEETDYVEFCTAKGGMLSLDHYPVYKITEISAITPGIKIKNTSQDSRNAYVSVDTDSLDLVVVGGTNAMTATLAFADYATLALMVAAINAEAKGWAAEIYDTDYASYPSAALMEVNNFFCGASRGTAPTYRYLEMLDTPYTDYTVDEATGIVYRSSWASGFRKVVAKYSAYNTVPEDIIGAVLDGVKFLVADHEEGTEGVKSYRVGDLSVTFSGEGAPASVLKAIELHTRVM